MKYFNILVTCAGGDLSPYLINFLKNDSKHKDLKVIAIDYKANAIGKYFSDFFEEVPKGDSINYIKKMKNCLFWALVLMSYSKMIYLREQ